MLQLRITDKKDFMRQLLTSTIFDSFDLVEATIACANTYTIDGRTNLTFFDQQDLQDNPSLGQEFRSWESQKPICFSLIKGKKTPLHFKFVMYLTKSEMLSCLSTENNLPIQNDIKAFVLTIKFDGTAVYLTTATSYNTFTLDKSLEKVWDKFLLQLLFKHSVSYEQTI